MQYLYGWLVIISILAVGITASDKRAARCRRRRVPENTLLLVALLGGSAAMLLTMLLIRHKTKKAKFMVGIPCILFAQAVLLAWGRSMV